MKTNGIEDILIGESYRSTKKSNKFILIILFILLILLCGMGYAYYYFSNQEVSGKAEFAKNLSKVEVKKYFADNVYIGAYKKLISKNSEVKSKIEWSTTLENEKLENVDVSKFALNLNNKINNKDKVYFLDTDLYYSGNRLIDIKAIADEEKIAALSDDVVNSYVSVKYEHIKDYFGYDIDINAIKKYITDEAIELTVDDVEANVKKMIEIADKYAEEKDFSIDNNKVLEKNGKSVDVTVYKMELSEQKFNNILVDYLNYLNENEELLNKIATDKSSGGIKLTPTNEDEVETRELERPVIVIPSNNEQNQSAPQEETQEENRPEALPQIESQEQEQQPQVFVQDQISEEDQEEVTRVIQMTQAEMENLQATRKIDNSFVKYLSDDMFCLFTGRKINKSISEIQEDIDDMISNAKIMEGDGFTFTIYASSEKIEKISITMPNKNIIEVTFNNVTNKELKANVTYLFVGDNSSLINFGEVENLGDETNGVSIDFDYIKEDINSRLICGFNFIENKSINEKLSIDFNTEGKTSSKKIDQDIVITYSNKDGENKFVVENSINFLDNVDIEDLTIDNCVELETLSEEDRNATIPAIKDKVAEVYKTKKESLDFYDINTKENTLDKISSSISHDDARQALYNRVVELMTEAEEKGKPFTINNLKDLKIDGYNVSTTIENDVATIIVDIYAFTIDSQFNLADK